MATSASGPKASLAAEPKAPSAKAHALAHVGVVVFLERGDERPDGVVGVGTNEGEGGGGAAAHGGVAGLEGGDERRDGVLAEGGERNGGRVADDAVGVAEGGDERAEGGFRGGPIFASASAASRRAVALRSLNWSTQADNGLPWYTGSLSSAAGGRPTPAAQRPP